MRGELAAARVDGRNTGVSRRAPWPAVVARRIPKNRSRARSARRSPARLTARSSARPTSVSRAPRTASVCSTTCDRSTNHGSTFGTRPPPRRRRAARSRSGERLLVAERGERIVVGLDVRGTQVGASPLEAPPRLPERLLERAADRHHLAHGFHRGRECRLGLRELLEREPRHLHDDVVERRLERGRVAGDVVHDLVESVADREQRGDLRDREPVALEASAEDRSHAGSSRSAPVVPPSGRPRTGRWSHRSPPRSRAGTRARRRASPGTRGR